MSSRRRQDKGGGVRVSWSSLAGIVSILVITGILYNVGKNVATRADVDSVKAAISPTLERHETRIRDLELQMASHFGASPTGLHQSNTVPPVQKAGFVLAQYGIPVPVPAQSAQIPPRRVVVPKELVVAYGLEPSRGGTYVLLGDDGRFYSLDDVLAALIKIHMDEREFQKNRLK